MTTQPDLRQHRQPTAPAGADDRWDAQGSAQIAMDYAHRMFERQHVMLPPLGFQVDWADQPSRHKLYLDTVRVPLPEPFRSLPSITLSEAVGSARQARTPGISAAPELGVLATMLGCYGLVGRRTTPNWNPDSDAKIRAAQAVWARPTASGGGRYPAESYLVTGRCGALPPGVYHYDTAHHSLDRLSVGDQCDALAEATGVRADLYAVSTLRFWKNTFKYNSFGYHVVTQDAGALLASWRLVLAAHRIPAEPVLWFDESVVGAVLEVDGCEEAPFVVVPLGPTAASPPGPGTPGPGAPRPGARIGGNTPHRVWEQSRRTRSFEMVSSVHAAALVGGRPRPGPGAAQGGADFAPFAGGSDVLALPDPVPLPADLDLGESLRGRRTSFGLLRARPPLDARDLGWVLSSVARAGLAGTDVAPAPRGHPWTRQWVLANSVAGLEQRAYGYDAERHGLVAGPALEVDRLQTLYALGNYSLPEVAAIIVVTGRLDALVTAYGARGYRMLSIEAGSAVQTAYLAATARGLGVGAVLGLDNIRIDELLGIAGTGERSMIFMLLGHERTPTLRYDHDLYRGSRGATGAARGGTIQ